MKKALVALTAVAAGVGAFLVASPEARKKIAEFFRGRKKEAVTEKPTKPVTEKPTRYPSEEGGEGKVGIPEKQPRPEEPYKPPTQEVGTGPGQPSKEQAQQPPEGTVTASAFVNRLDGFVRVFVTAKVVKGAPADVGLHVDVWDLDSGALAYSSFRYYEKVSGEVSDTFGFWGEDQHHYRIVVRAVFENSYGKYVADTYTDAYVTVQPGGLGIVGGLVEMEFAP